MDLRPDPAELSRRYCEVRSLTEALAAPLCPEDQTVQSMPDVSPTKWHRAHTTWFFEEFVLGPDHHRHHPDYAFLFNSYYEAVGERHPRAERGALSRPTAAEVGEYRRAVDREVLAWLDHPVPDRLEVFELGLHHEQQHQELLLMDAKHVLSQGPLDTAYGSRREKSDQMAAPLGWTTHDGGIVEIGHVGDGFAYDNESPRHRVLVEPFAVADRPVTAGEWCEFIADGGYQRADLWLSEGWATVQGERWTAPLYWQAEPDTSLGWTMFTLAGRRPVDAHEPVCHVSYFEADAFARWAGARLPSEAEWEVAATSAPSDERACLDLEMLHPAVTQESGPSQFIGGVWEWTASPYTPYPGFTPAAGAVGEYNGKFMVNQQVLRGGSCVTPRGHIRSTYRNFFPAASRWAFSGLRLARSE